MILDTPLFIIFDMKHVTIFQMKKNLIHLNFSSLQVLCFLPHEAPVA